MHRVRDYDAHKVIGTSPYALVWVLQPLVLHVQCYITYLTLTLKLCGPIIRPPLTSDSILTGIFVNDGTVVVEDSPLILRYNKIAGGRRAKAQENHLVNETETVLTACKKTTDGGGKFTVDERVTVTHV